MKKYLACSIAAILMWFAVVIPAQSSQNSCIMPNTGTLSGLTLVNDVTACANSLLTLYSGASAPSSPQTYQFWVDTSATPATVKQYDGTTWLVVGNIDAVSHVWKPPVGGGMGAVTAAATTNLCAVPDAVQTVSGTTTITSFGSSCPTVGVTKTLIFAAATPITYNSTSMIIPGGANYTAAVGDIMDVINLGSGNWRVKDITKADGTSVINTSVPLGTILYGAYGIAPTKFVLGFGQPLARASFPAYLAAVTRTQTVTSTNGNNTLTSVPDTGGLGAGMPIESPGNVGVPAGTTIISVTASTIVMSQNANNTGTPAVTAFMTGYGTAGSSSTVGVPECRGVAMYGRGNMGGTAVNRLTPSFFGDGNRTGAIGGSQSTTMIAANLAQHQHSVFLSDPGHTHGFSSNNANSANSSSTTGGGAFSIPTTSGASIIIAPNVTGITISDGAGHPNLVATTPSSAATAMQTVSPGAIAECIVAVLP